ncbi:MAG: HEAT repeat domain-containing protein [Candidatus Eremiobacterota bacterium]
MKKKFISILFILITCTISFAQITPEGLVQRLGSSDDKVVRDAISALESYGKGAVPLLIDTLSTDDDRLRRNAVIVLGRISDTRAIEPLVVMLGSNDELTGVYATQALWRIGEPAVLPLVSSLSSEDYQIKLNAVKTLGRIGDNRAVDGLIKLCSDENEKIRAYAVNSLGYIKDKRALDTMFKALVSDNEFVGRYAVEALIYLGKPSVPLLIEGLKHENTYVRMKCASALGRIGDREAVEPLIEAMWDKNEQVRGASANALGFIGDRRAFEILFVKMGDEDTHVQAYSADALIRLGNFAIDFLIKRLNDDDETIRVNATKILGRMGDSRAVPALTEILLKDKSYLPRAYAASALGLIGDTSSIDILCTSLGDENELVRLHSIEALSRIGTPSVEALIFCLTSARGKVREGACEALGFIGDTRAIDPLIHTLDLYDSSYENAKNALVRIGEPAVDTLILHMNDGTVKNKAFIAEVLGSIGDNKAVPCLCNSLLNDDDPVKIASAAALGNIGNKGAVTFLCTLLEGSYSDPVRISAVESLKAINDPSAIHFLTKSLNMDDERVNLAILNALNVMKKVDNPASVILLLNSSNPVVRASAASVLGVTEREEAVEPLLSVLEDKDDTVRLEAVKALGNTGDPRAVEPLVNRLYDKKQVVQSAAVRALGKIGEPSIEPLIKLLRTEHAFINFYVINSLAHVGKPAIAPMIALLKDKDNTVREGAAKVLIRIGDNSAVEPLIEALKDDDRYVRAYAITALGNIGDERAVEPISQSVDEYDSLSRINAVYALAHIGRPAQDTVVKNLKSNSPVIRACAVKALGYMGNKDVVPDLISAMNDSDIQVRMNGAISLGSLGDSRALDVLIKALKDDYKYVRLEAANALLYIGDRRAIAPLKEALSIEGDEEVTGALKNAIRMLEQR